MWTWTYKYALPILPSTAEEGQKARPRKRLLCRAFCITRSRHISVLSLQMVSNQTSRRFIPDTSTWRTMYSVVGEDIEQCAALIHHIVKDRNLQHRRSINHVVIIFGCIKLRNAGESTLNNANATVQTVLGNSLFLGKITEMSSMWLV